MTVSPATSIAIYGTLGTSVPSCQASYAIDGLVMASNLQPTVNLPGQISPMFGTQLFTVRVFCCTLESAPAHRLLHPVAAAHVRLS
jgi:hypothetical protein